MHTGLNEGVKGVIFGVHPPLVYRVNGDVGRELCCRPCGVYGLFVYEWVVITSVRSLGRLTRPLSPVSLSPKKGTTLPSRR